MAQPWLKYQAPSPIDDPITLGHPDPYKARDQQLQEEAAARAREDQQFQRQKFATEQANAGKPKLEKLPLGASNAIQENLKSLQQVEDSLKVLDTRPSSIGPGTGMLGDTFTQWNDPQGVDVRAKVGNIGAVKIHDLSGAAVSATEAPRFQPFVPTVSDLPGTAKKKLENFRDQLRAQVKEQLDYTHNPANGYLPYSTPQADEFLRSGATPNVTTAPTDQGFDKAADPRLTELNQAQSDAYDAWWKAHPDPTPDQLRAFGSSLGINIGNAEKIIETKKRSGSISHDLQYTPDISDVRGSSGIGEKLDAGIRGAADVVSFGLADKVAAAGDTIFNPDTSFGQNMAREYAISDYDTENHFPSRTAGQVAGGFAVPMGEISSLPQLALKGAGVGGAYGAGSSRSLADVPQNALLGATAGAVLPTALVGAGRGIGAAARGFRRAPSAVPPLVDPTTGRLNEPLEAMRPGQRVSAAQDFGVDLPLGAATDRGGAIIEKGLDNLPGSAGVMNDARRVAEGQVQGAVEQVAGKSGSSRTLNESGAEAQRGIKEWMTRGDAVAAKVFNAIPISPEARTTNTATIATLQNLTSKLQSNPELAEEIKDPILGRYLIAIQEKGLNWQDLKDFRSYIGNKIGQFRLSQDSRHGDYRALYAALSEDMKSTAAVYPKAARALERANSFYAAKEQRIEQSLSRLIGNDMNAAPEKAAAAIQAMTKGGKGTGDLKTLAAVKASTIKSGAWDEIAATMIRMGGQPVNSPGRSFDPRTFVQWYSDMAEPARKMLFKPELRKELERFVSVNQRLANSNALRNTSQTVPNFIGTGYTAAAGAAMYAGSLPGILAIAGETAANYGMAKLWTSPKFVQWATGYSRAAAAGNQSAAKSQIGRLTKLATTNPELRVPIENLLKNLANDNALPALAASPGASPDQNQQ